MLILQKRSPLFFFLLKSQIRVEILNLARNENDPLRFFSFALLHKVGDFCLPNYKLVKADLNSSHYASLPLTRLCDY